MSDALIHPTAEIQEDARIGSGTRIWQHCIVMAGAVIGAECKLGHNVFVETDVVVGDGVTIKDNVTLYEGVTIGDRAFIGPNAVFTNVRNPRAFISRKQDYQPTIIGEGASIGANATLFCGVTVGRYALVGAGAVVIKDVADHALVAGNPARAIGWVGRAGVRLGDDLACPETGERYEKTESGLMLEDTLKDTQGES
ncbi:MAG: DapH/DapD/GlmU-related protein [Rhodospirillales bacterium]|jgi:UDP-2-acetamido-3-amino-2,3-dideoxy-glucuronate N-acetyltransferase|nr:N-acetyltransferase [Chloroflexota bacterium]MDP6172543.1 DapH/DapD/GlmU-related protein [Rhodospirillales bacterium]